MSISILLAEKIAQLFLILLMGYLVVRVGLLKPEDSRVLSVIMVYLVMPCMILNAFQIDNTPEVRTGIAYSFVVAGIMHLLFLALTVLLKKPLTKITINDIADDCGINRMTFYYHFKDIYDLVEWSCLEDAKRALDENKTYETWQQGFLQIFEAVQDNKPFILNVYRCVHREQVEKYLQPLVDRLLLDVINEEAGEMKVRDEDKQFIAQIYSYIFIGLMLDWIKDDMREDPQQIVDRLAKLIKGSVSAALSRFQF